MTAGAKEKRARKDKLTPNELEKRHLCLQKLRDSGEYERYENNEYDVSYPFSYRNLF